MPNIDWTELLAGIQETRHASSIRPEDAQVCFDIGDGVQFSATNGAKLTGIVEKLNPKRANVRCSADTWVVPYAGLEHTCASTAEDRRLRATRLLEFAAQARELMDRHGLEDWTLRFNSARKLLGQCRPQQRHILLSRAHAVNGPIEQVTDTILHEIAHALAGPAAGHGPSWKAIAVRLGAAPKSCAPESEQARHGREAAKAKFRTGDTVCFIARGVRRTGVIVRMNPKRAKVECGEITWLVPYTRLSAPECPDCSHSEN